MRQIGSNEIPSGWRTFNCDNGKIYAARYNSCLFCSHCTDIFYDYTHGPYMTFCELGNNTDAGFSGDCYSFARDGVEE